MLSPNDAAKRVGKSKTTILRAIKNGRLSATRDDNGNHQIDPSELARVFGGGAGAPVRAPEHGAPRTGANVPSGAGEIDLLKVRLEAAEQTIEDRDRELQHRDGTITDLRQRLDKSEQERSVAQTKLTALLTDQRPLEAQERRSGPRWWLVLVVGLLAGGAIAWAITQLPMASV
jgi:hypothetical protein